MTCGVGSSATDRLGVGRSGIDGWVLGRRSVVKVGHGDSDGFERYLDLLVRGEWAAEAVVNSWTEAETGQTWIGDYAV